MQTILFILKAYGVSCGASLLLIALIAAWDWYVFRRLPYVRWLASHHGWHGRSMLRELTRVKRRDISLANGTTHRPTIR